MRFDALVVEGGEAEAESLLGALEEKFNASRYHGKSGNLQVLLLEEFYFRIGSYLSVTIIADFEDSTSCRIETVSAAGHDTLGGDWGAEGSAIDKKRKFIETYASKKGMKVRTVDSRFISVSGNSMHGPTPRNFLKTCITCGKRILIASEECKFCGAHQQD